MNKPTRLVEGYLELMGFKIAPTAFDLENGNHGGKTERAYNRQ